MNDWKCDLPKENIVFETKNGILYNCNIKDVLDKIPDNFFDLVLTDPPYKVTARGNAGNAGGMLTKKINLRGKVFENNDIEVHEWMPKVLGKLKNNTHFYIMTNHKNLFEYLKLLYELPDIYFIKSLIWDKGNKIMGQFYMSQFEYILFGRKGNAKKINNCGTSDIISIPNKKTKINGENIHDTEKPVALMELLIKNSTQKNEVVFEPFAGSGSTLLAAEKSNRKWIGVEIDEKYCEVIKMRMLDSLESLF